MKFKLKSAHYWPGDLYLVGDKESQDNGTLVGDDTRYPIKRLSEAKPGEMTPTLEMEPLDDEAREALDEEIERLNSNQASMVPIEQLALTLSQAQMTDRYEERNVPGFGPRRGK